MEALCTRQMSRLCGNQSPTYLRIFFTPVESISPGMPRAEQPGPSIQLLVATTKLSGLSPVHRYRCGIIFRAFSARDNGSPHWMINQSAMENYISPSTTSPALAVSIILSCAVRQAYSETSKALSNHPSSEGCNMDCILSLTLTFTGLSRSSAS